MKRAERELIGDYLGEIDAIDEGASGRGGGIYREPEVPIHAHVVGEQLVRAGAQRLGRRRLPREHGARGQLALEHQTPGRRHTVVRAAHLAACTAACTAQDTWSGLSLSLSPRFATKRTSFVTMKCTEAD